MDSTPTPDPAPERVVEVPAVGYIEDVDAAVLAHQPADHVYRPIAEERAAAHMGQQIFMVY